MRVLALYEYPPSPSGLATQGDLLYQGLRQLGVEVQPVHLEANQEKEWYYRWFRPDVVVGVGYWGYTPYLVLHPQRFGMQAVPWLVADGYIANYREVLNGLPLILVTSNWVKQVYARDGINPDLIEVLPVGCDPDRFHPRPRRDPQVQALREALGVGPDELMLLTVGGDAASKGRAGGDAGAGADQARRPALALCVQSLAAAAHGETEPARPGTGGAAGDCGPDPLRHRLRLPQLHAVSARRL